MPTVNIFHRYEDKTEDLTSSLNPLKDFIATELSCDDIVLTPDEISVRLIGVQGEGMIAPLEIEITAHAFDDRIKRQDDICLHVREFVQQALHPIQDVRVWLLLPELGHSWDQ